MGDFDDYIFDPSDDPSLNHWRMCDELSLVEAALLICGMEPSKYRYVQRNKLMPSRYEAMKAALIYAVKGKRLPATPPQRTNELGEPDWDGATILVADLRPWLRSRGINTGFFFPASKKPDQIRQSQEPDRVPDYLSPSHKCYSSKLAAAIDAWKAVSADAELRRGKSVKQALVAWLEKHAAQYALATKTGKPNKQGIEEVAKIANWERKGGVPKTPGSD
jgi:hypothetical protein